MQQKVKQFKAKLILAGCLLAALIVVYGYSSVRTGPAQADVAHDDLRSRLQGTWEGAGSTPGMRQIKLITRNHFTWVFYNNVTHNPVTVAGGTCSFVGDTYTEHVEFGSSGVQQSLAGHDQVFKIKLQGNRLYERGTLSNGMKINESWRRLE
ncbi:MAG: hypothetical protein JO316_09410 [Abitibacteriaceae bacterium]|nr:hypothetical protein [Abditibacteriaceae bacterium]